MDYLAAFIVINMTGMTMMLIGIFGLAYTNSPRWPKVLIVAGAFVALSAWSISAMLDTRAA